jgi:hypothetical protein
MQGHEESTAMAQLGISDSIPATTAPTSTLTAENTTSEIDAYGGPNDADDLEAAKKPPNEISVLSATQHYRLQHHQKKLSRSHTFYQPHETETHYAFPIKYLIAIVCLLDAHSCLQISLGACTWSIDYHTRPFALTTVILCISIACNITAGVLISLGDRKTRKKDVSKLLERQELTGLAIEKLERTWQKEQKEKVGEQGAAPEEPDHCNTRRQTPGEEEKNTMAGISGKTENKVQREDEKKMSGESINGTEQ